MNHLMTWIFVAALLALVVAIVWLLARVIRGVLAHNVGRRRLHRMTYPLIGLGLLLSVPSAMAHSPVEPASDGVIVVTCTLNDRDPEEVLQALARRDPHLFDELGEGCHKPANGVLSTTRSCTLFPKVDETSTCYGAPTKTFAIFDSLSTQQRRELTEVWLDQKQIETIYMDPSHPAELLIIAMSEARTYNYSLKLETDYSANYCPKSQDRSRDGTIDIASHSFLVVIGEGCTSRDRKAVWLDDWAPLLN